MPPMPARNAEGQLGRHRAYVAETHSGRATAARRAAPVLLGRLEVSGRGQLNPQGPVADVDQAKLDRPMRH